LNAAFLRYNTVNRPLFISNLNFAWLNSIYNSSLIKKAHSFSLSPVNALSADTLSTSIVAEGLEG
jgi:hypothetical protein